MKINAIDVNTAQIWVQNDEAIIIDVREESEYQDYRIEGVPLAPLSNLPVTIQNIDIPQDKKIIFQCLKGGRSAQAIEFLQENYLKNHDLYNMEGGITAWVAANLPVIHGDA